MSRLDRARRRGTRAATALATLAALAALLYAAPPSPAATLPTVTPSPPGTHGYPYDAAQPSLLNLSSVGYAEHEYLMSGVTNIYRENGTWSSNGRWSVAVSQSNVPYTTRLLIRYPTNPAKFNGSVVFEWMNDTTGGDQDPIWAQMNRELIREGFAYVGVTAQNAGLVDLKAWDPARYGSLGDTNDGQSYDIFTQAAQVVRAEGPALLGGLTPRELIGTGDSQSAFRVDTYVNAFQPLSHAFSAFIAVGRWAGAAPIGNGFVGFPDPSLVRTDNTAPFIQVNSQGDIEQIGAAVARQPDNGFLRTWEVAGTSHIDDNEGGYEVLSEYIEQPKSISVIPTCTLGTPVAGTGTPLDGVNQADNMPLWEVEDAAAAAMQKWLTTGVAAPHEPSQLSVVPVFLGLFDLVPTNQYGVASGGIQLPEAQVPTEDYSPINFSIGTAANYSIGALLTDLQDEIGLYTTGGIPITNTAARNLGLCLLSGYFTDLSSSALSALYPTDASYVAKYTAAVNADVAAGFITPADGAAAIANAQAGNGPVQGPPVETIP